MIMFSDFSESKKKKKRQGNETATWYFALQLCTLHHTLKSRQTSPSAWWWKREQNPAKGAVFWEKRNEVLVSHSWQSSSVFQTSGIQINRTREEIFCKCLITSLIHGMVFVNIPFCGHSRMSSALLTSKENLYHVIWGNTVSATTLQP